MIRTLDPSSASESAVAIHQTNEQVRTAWPVMASAAVIPLGLSCAATVTSYLSRNEKVPVTAWVAVAIVGTAAVICAAAASKPRRIPAARVARSDGQV